MAGSDTFTISDSDLERIKDQVVIVTGASSGIGLATVKRLAQHGAKVYAGDLNPLPSPLDKSIPFQKVDVTSWQQQLELFKRATEKYGKIDHVFANAGITPTITLLEDDVDENGDLLPPDLKTINVNFLGCLYTVKLGIHYIKKNPDGGSIVMTGSLSSLTRFSSIDYTAAKHAVLGMVRALYGNLHPKLPIRVNSIAPSWTDTGILPRPIAAALGEAVQSADIVARSVVLLMTDQNCHGEMIYSDRGKFKDIETGDNGLHDFTSSVLGIGQNTEDFGLKKAIEVVMSGGTTEARQE